MEQVETLFREGVLSHLEQLETLSDNLTEKQAQGRQQEDVLQGKRELLLQLEKERDELLAQTRRQREEIQALTTTDEESRPLQPRTREALRDLRLEEMMAAAEALWFTGISGKKTDNGFCICLSTAFEGHYLDSYYVQMHNMEAPRIGHHSIPAFIPLRKIAKLLPANKKKFLSDLSAHLNGFAGRKFQADRLQDASGIYVPDTLERNSLHNVISFSYNLAVDGRTFCFSAKLLYGVVTAVLPTEAQVTCPGENSAPVQEALSSHSALFCRTPLHRALQSLSAQDGTAPSHGE